jgi:hypothetical protein
MPGTSQVSETQPQLTVVGFQNTTPENFANDISMGDSTAGSTRPTTPISDPGRPKLPPVTSSQTGPQIPSCLLPTNTQPFDKGNIYTRGEIFDDFERDRFNHKMNWITWAIGAGNAALLEMFQHKIVTMHQDLTNQNTNLLSRINFLEQANANQSRQLLNMEKKMETADEAATQMVAGLYKKAASNQQTPLKTITMKKNKKRDKEGKAGKPASYAAVAKSNTSQDTNVTSKTKIRNNWRNRNLLSRPCTLE